MSKSKVVRIKFNDSLEDDIKLLEYIESIPRGVRSQRLKEMLRKYLEGQNLNTSNIAHTQKQSTGMSSSEKVSKEPDYAPEGMLEYSINPLSEPSEPSISDTEEEHRPEVISSENHNSEPHEPLSETSPQDPDTPGGDTNKQETGQDTPIDLDDLPPVFRRFMTDD